MKEFLKVPQPTEMLRMLHKNEVSAEQLEGIYGKRNEKYPRRSKHRVYVSGIGPFLQKRRKKIEVSKLCVLSDWKLREVNGMLKVVFGAFSTSLTSLGLAVVRPLLSMKKLCQSTCAKTVPGGVKRLTLAQVCVCQFLSKSFVLER